MHSYLLVSIDVWMAFNDLDNYKKYELGDRFQISFGEKFICLAYVLWKECKRRWARGDVDDDDTKLIAAYVQRTRNSH